MSAPAMTPPSSDGYFSQPSTRWDIIKFLIPLAIGFAGFLGTLYISDMAHGVALAEAQAKITEFSAAKEDRGQRLAVLEKQFADSQAAQIRRDAELRDALRDINGDIKTILSRLPR